MNFEGSIPQTSLKILALNKKPSNTNTTTKPTSRFTMPSLSKIFKFPTETSSSDAFTPSSGRTSSVSSASTYASSTYSADSLKKNAVTTSVTEIGGKRSTSMTKPADWHSLGVNYSIGGMGRF